MSPVQQTTGGFPVQRLHHRSQGALCWSLRSCVSVSIVSYVPVHPGCSPMVFESVSSLASLRVEAQVFTVTTGYRPKHVHRTTSGSGESFAVQRVATFTETAHTRPFNPKPQQRDGAHGGLTMKTSKYSQICLFAERR